MDATEIDKIISLGKEISSHFSYGASPTKDTGIVGMSILALAIDRHAEAMNRVASAMERADKINKIQG